MDYKELLNKAKEVSSNAYAPYSNFLVGAAILFKDGSFFTGCNVENASYGLALCAERNAISTSIAQGKNPKDIKAVAIYSPNTPKCFPCGACRQWMIEFSDDIEVIFEDENKEFFIYKISELLPHKFEL